MPSPLDSDRSPLLVLAPEDPLAPQILAQLSVLFPGQSLARFADLHAAVLTGGEAAIILPVAHPAEAIARHLAASGTVAQALAVWTAGAEPMLAAARRVRRRLRLVDARALAEGEAKVLAQLAPAGSIVLVPDRPSPPDAVLLVIAEAALLHDPDALGLAGEIAALRRGGEGRGVCAEGSEAALDDYRQAKAAQQTTARLQAEGVDLAAKTSLLETEVSLLRESLALQIDDLGTAEQTIKILAEASQRDRDTVADLSLQTAKLRALEHQLERAAERAARREAVLATVLLKDQQDLLANAATQARAEGLEHELNSVYASKSWRVTGPLRALRAKS
ncbi:hypothetical protein [Pseudotabrizicola formosa]|uniref:hypothetical protein n=1 Tax=Pseudotabrizicola formosa TaxID=2030009 RepID=UPI000CD0CD28|nr:hypothetical protein [Pseudotabrizicola formosa]